MARSSATRRGNGAGWGGPAKGAGNQDAGPGRPDGVRTGEGKVTVAELLAAMGGRQVSADAWMAILRDPTHPHHANMVAKAADRMDGQALARVELRDADPDSMTDEELAAIASRGSRASVGPEADKA